MINNSDNTINLIGEDGKSKTYDILIMFEAEENNKTYIVYTEHELDDDGFIKTYAGIYNKDSLLPVENDEEWELIDSLLKKLEEKNKGVANEKID